MSLIDELTEDFTILTKTYVDDGIGGYRPTYTDGVTINAAMAFTSSLNTNIAQAQGVSSVYSLVTKKNIVLEYHDVLRRERDQKIFRVTSDGDDEYTPPSAGLNMRRVSCEEWKLPEG